MKHHPKRAAGALVILGAVAVGLMVVTNDDGIPPVGSLSADVSPATAKTRLGACEEKGDVDYAPPFDYLSDVDRWLEVRSLDREAAAAQPSDRHVPMTFRAETVRPSAEGGGDQRDEDVVVHGSTLPGIDWALRSGGRPFLALGPERVQYVLIELADGGHLFAGYCQFQSLTEPVYKRLGERADAALHSIVGETDADTVLARLVQEIPAEEDRT